MNELGKDKKLIEVCFQYEGNRPGFDSYSKEWFVVPRTLEIPKHKIIMLAPKFYADGKFPIKLVFVNQEIIPDEAIGDLADKLAYTDLDSKLKRAKEPFFTANVELDSYFEGVSAIQRKNELKAELNSALKEVRELVDLEVLVNYRPDLKEKLDEYKNLLPKQNLLQANATKVLEENQN